MAIDVSSGQLLWTRETTTPLLAKQLLAVSFAGDLKDRFYAIKADDGAVYSDHKISGPRIRLQSLAPSRGRRFQNHRSRQTSVQGSYRMIADEPCRIESEG